MTATEAYDLTTHGGAIDFVSVIRVCESFGPYCVIGGLAVNWYVEPVYTLDADIVLIARNLRSVAEQLGRDGFETQEHVHSLNAHTAHSDLRVQFTTDGRYQRFLERSVRGELFGTVVRVACLEDLVQGKLWAYGDPERRLSKRKKDELDLVRLAEKYPQLKVLYPAELRQQIDRG